MPATDHTRNDRVANRVNNEHKGFKRTIMSFISDIKIIDQQLISWKERDWQKTENKESQRKIEQALKEEIKN